MTVLLPKSMKSKQEKLYKIIFFFLIAHAVSSEIVVHSLPCSMFENGMFIWGYKPKKTFDTKIKNALYLLPAPPPQKNFQGHNII